MMDKLRVLIVDDEEIVIRGLRALLSERWPDFEVRHAENGQLALSMSKSFQPDLVITDVRMPLTDGLTYMERMVEAELSPAVLVISGYDNFDYVQKAMDLGAIHYVLKPIQQEQLILKLEPMVDRILDQRSRTDRIRAVSTNARRDLLAELARHAVLPDNIPDWARFDELSGPFDGYAVGAFRFPAFDWWLTQEERFRLEAYLGGLPKAVEQALCAESPESICTETEPGMFFLVVSASATRHGTLEKLTRSIEQESQFPLWVGWSSVKVGAELIHDGSQEATRDMLSRLDHETVCANLSQLAVSGSAPLEWGIWNALRKSFCDASRSVRSATFEPVEDLVSRIMDLSHPGSGRTLCFRSACLYLLSATWSLLASHRPTDRSSSAPDHLHCPLWIPGSRKDLERRMTESVQHARSHGFYSIATNPIVHEAYAFARMNCMSVTLRAAAEHVGVSPVHLSRLFRQVTGRTFIDTVVDFRVDLARRYLADPSARVCEVAERVGYSDPKYFARVFRRQTGQTPTEYRKHLVAQHTS